METKLIFSAAVLIVLLGSCDVAVSAEIKGTVRSATKNTATIAIQGQLTPNVGDPVQIYFKLAGSDVEISVGSGKVTTVHPGSIEAKIDKATGTVATDQLARITSQNPKKISPRPPDQPAAADAAAVQQIEQVIRKINDAWEENDAAALDKLLAAEYTHHDIYGRVENRSQWLESIRTRRSRLSVAYNDVRIKVYGAAAVATGRGTVEDATNPQHPKHLTFTEVFIRTQDGWKRAFFQGTSIPEK